MPSIILDKNMYKPKITKILIITIEIGSLFAEASACLRNTLVRPAHIIPMFAVKFRILIG